RLLELKARRPSEPGPSNRQRLFPLRTQFVLLRPRRVVIARVAHAVDGGESELRFRPPRLRRALPFVGAAASELVEEAGEAGVELLGAAVDTGELPHGERRCRRLHFADARKQLVRKRDVAKLLGTDL